MIEKNSSSERYQRQVTLRELGAEGQQKLLQAKVVVVGAGGLGCPALLYLAAAGVGTIGIVDNDIVSITNLHRQVIYTTRDLGDSKAAVAARRLQELNPEIQVRTHQCLLSNKNALSLLKEYDLVVDATDNMVSRYIISDACLLLKKPFVYGGISRFEGQVAVLNCGTTTEPPVTFRDLFPQPPSPESIANCVQTGVLGVLPGMIGTMQATEVLKLLTGIGQPLIHRLFTYDALTNNSYTFQLIPRKEAVSGQPQNPTAFEQTDYESFCDLPNSTAEEISSTTFQSLLKEPGVLIIDVREAGELPEVNEFEHLKVPLSGLRANMPYIANGIILLFCQTGKRSRIAAEILQYNYGQSRKIYSLKGGILNWKPGQL